MPMKIATWIPYQGVIAHKLSPPIHRLAHQEVVESLVAFVAQPGFVDGAKSRVGGIGRRGYLPLYAFKGSTQIGSARAQTQKPHKEQTLPDFTKNG